MKRPRQIATKPPHVPKLLPETFTTRIGVAGMDFAQGVYTVRAECRTDTGRTFVTFTQVTESAKANPEWLRSELMFTLGLYFERATKHIRHRPRFAVSLKK